MNTGLVSIPAESVKRLGLLAPFGGILAVLYLLLGAVCAYAAFGEYQFSLERQPDRLPYLIVIFASFELLVVLSAFRTWQAATLLHCLRRQPTAALLISALAKTRHMLLLFFAWLIFSISAYNWLAFHPIY